MNRISKTIATGLTGIILATNLAGCGESPEEEAARLERERARVEARIEREKAELAAYEARLDSQLERIDGLVQYFIPTVDIKSKRSSFTLDPFTHMKDAMKAQTITFPVSQEYYDSVRVGEEITSKFNWAGFLLDGDIKSYKNTISGKEKTPMYCAIVDGKCEEISRRRFEELLNRGREVLPETGTSPVMYVKSDREVDSSDFSDSCRVGIETSKTNYTLDIFKHIENSFNEMNFELSFPRFLCDQLTVGRNIDRNFVGASLLFSRSPSQVNYKVTSIKKDY